MLENGSAPASDTLNGWKEIAGYLGKSVRSVQRWERDLALPVHRIATAEGGQIVYSSRSEIDSWRVGLDATSASDVDRDRDGNGNTATAHDGAPGRAASAPRRVIAWAAFGALTVVVATAVGFRAAPRFVGHPTHFEVEGQQ